MNELPCPCCGFLTLEGQYGSYAICPVCGWEDDGVQLANPTSGAGANKRSLAQAQEAALSTHPHHINLAAGYRRGQAWRPLLAKEIVEANVKKTEKHWHTVAVLIEAEAYWAKEGLQIAVADVLGHRMTCGDHWCHEAAEPGLWDVEQAHSTARVSR